MVGEQTRGGSPRRKGMCVRHEKTPAWVGRLRKKNGRESFQDRQGRSGGRVLEVRPVSMQEIELLVCRICHYVSYLTDTV